ncbi:hypothetical protein B0H17DRAFT_1339324 [Mycena rosella]|uniref:Uncharacterized protein n=1 Tax=Mycena rosella TaxID=1033263 RepID=A0AAD7C6H1_MYCRO|nr:hypothetical protein B0H17DRAFT_1339324 [Mycena rosella]
MPVPVSITPQPAPLPPSFGRAPSQSQPHATPPSGAGHVYPSSAGVSLSTATPHAPGASSRSPSYPSSASSYAALTPGPMPLRAVRVQEYDGDTNRLGERARLAKWVSTTDGPRASAAPPFAPFALASPDPTAGIAGIAGIGALHAARTAASAPHTAPGAYSTSFAAPPDAHAFRRQEIARAAAEHAERITDAASP